MLKRMVRLMLIGSGVTVLVMTLAMIWLKTHEDELVFAAARSRQHMLTVLPADAELAAVSVPSGSQLAGLVYHPAAGADKAFWVLHLHGNADSAFSPGQVRHCEALRRAGFNVLEIDYRGFGPTPGLPSEAGMYEDSEAAYQDLVRRGVPPNRIILLGHSLGSGPAVLLATRHKAAALVLFGAFTSIPDAAAERYPYLPVRLAVAIQFNSLARIGDVHMPVVIAHSRGDTLIPYSHALKLFAAANEPKHLITFDFAADDGFGDHVDALYEHVDVLRSALAGLVTAMPPPLEL
ncbi:MAG TPA: alpha/beta fold hydrolase [Steroidobacteraceae bacterium]